MNKRLICIFTLLTALIMGVQAQVVTTNEEDTDEEDELIVIDEKGKEEIIEFPEAMTYDLDSLLNEYMAKTYLTPEDCNTTNENPSYPTEVFVERLYRLPTVMEMAHNEVVQQFIDRYCTRLRRTIGYALGASNFYMPIFEEALDLYQIPLELRNLPIIESALNPKAVSRVGATGLWQFMLTTGKTYGLQVNSLVDERRDPIKASFAAAHYLSDLYKVFGDWNLVIAAYNCGPANVNKAIQRSGGAKDYWQIYPYLPKETRGYVPAFIAVNYIMNYAPEHNICPLNPGIIKTGIDTVMVHDVLHFDQLNEMLGIPMEDLRFFNPQFKEGIIPATDKKQYVLQLPEQYIDAFVSNEKDVYSFKTKSGIDKEKLQEEMKKISDRSVHIVKKGETLSGIAKKYHVSVNQLKTWNNLKTTNLKIGQKLIVYSSGAPMAQVGNSKPVERSTTQKIHVVSKGETLSRIAAKYKCSVTDLKNWNNLKSTNIIVGQKLKVYPPAESSSNTVKNNASTYTVRSGYTLSGIAAKFNVSVATIKKLNNLKNDTIKVGQVLKLR